MKSLNLEVLKEIAIETRQCFLSEDAPTYLANFQKGLAQLQSGKPDYVFLMHAAHSLKGGSAIAELNSLSQIAHKLEDLLEILQHNEFCDRTTIAEVLSHGIDEVASVISQAVSLPPHNLADIKVDPELLQKLDSLLAIIKNPAEPSVFAHGESLEAKKQEVFSNHSTPQEQKNSKRSAIVISSLEKDLESCIRQVETLLSNPSALSESKIKEELQYFCEECLLLGDALSIDWLIDTVEPFEAKLQKELAIANLLADTKEVIDNLRSQRSQYLYPESIKPIAVEDVVDGLSPSEVEIVNSQITPSVPALEEPTNPSQAVIENQAITISPTEAISYLRIPSSQIESMTNTVAEMILRHERLLRQQQQLGQANKNLQALVLQMIPLQEQVQTIYDELTIANPIGKADSNTHNNDHDNTDIVDRTNLNDAFDQDDFDQLELDQYSSSHTTLQNLQEVLLRVRETRYDIDLSYRDFGEEIQYLRQDLDRLYAELTQSRLVPFKTIANRFFPQLKRLCQRNNKQVDLVIEGEEVLIDQVILEQLQTPLNHLIINAFDHGVEAPEVRRELGKPETAKITLSASLSGNQVIIYLQDDGDGINLNNVYTRAVEKNICPVEIPIGKIPRQEILNFIFQPHFSTRNTVTDISGRGMGLDIVRSQVNRLRGNIQVETLQGRGTTFTIRLPLGLSLVTLLICTINENLIAIPINDILDIFAYNEELVRHHPNFAEISWRKKSIPLIYLKQALNYGQNQQELINSKVCLVINQANRPITIAIDSIVEERQLIIKPFDNSVAVPSYLMGCTLLGTGQVVPVLNSDNLHILLKESIERNIKQNAKKIDKNTDNSNLLHNQTSTKTILIAEDSIATRNMLELVLKQLDFEIISCRDGQEAIDMLNRLQGKVSMVISDIEMPRVNGFNLLQTIRTHDHWYAMPVVMLTSRTGDRHRQKAISLGANQYLSKPIVVNELIECLGEIFK
ncbi:response regulator [Pseudanabaena sp. ABRG5-3]|uniref:hybrid sensor histidine kinase/response regulator n=1 Tax=Pseudanabaena sp. ABRG5-3 TaxID=685565 RepID=UPI0013A6850C|nr:response regulator [Pseudanabaena sp. ABRG5-3]